MARGRQEPYNHKCVRLLRVAGPVVCPRRKSLAREWSFVFTLPADAALIQSDTNPLTDLEMISVGGGENSLFYFCASNPPNPLSWLGVPLKQKGCGMAPAPASHMLTHVPAQGSGLASGKKLTHLPEPGSLQGPSIPAYLQSLCSLCQRCVCWSLWNFFPGPPAISHVGQMTGFSV